jgi:3D-(3,5/4)-trihydroxycyclohexane-1,2-dione acylhydrolase (decyclizing)
MKKSVSTAVVEGLVAQGVRKFFVILGHGTTDIGEALRQASFRGEVEVTPFRNEIEATHAATALRWVTDERVCVVTSIGPGALQAVAGSLVGVSNGVGVWFIFGDETTHDEGPNMQQIPNNGQASYLKMFSHMAETYLLHTPEAIFAAMNKGALVTNHPTRPQPFFLLLPINVQPKEVEVSSENKWHTGEIAKIGPAFRGNIKSAAEVLKTSTKVVIKVGRGAKSASREILDLADAIDGVFVMSPSSLGVIPSNHHRNMGIGGSKGSISGNYAMENAETLIVIGSRAVCQSDCSRTGYPLVNNVININADLGAVEHYNNSIGLAGDVKETIIELNFLLNLNTSLQKSDSKWLNECLKQKEKWLSLKTRIISNHELFDDNWQKSVLTQPYVINETLLWAEKNNSIVFFDAGDVQANGFQVAEINSAGWYFSESGSSYMGFASSALLATGLAKNKFRGVAVTGDGSFMMNPQVLIDAVHTHAKGCIVLLDNRRMGAISALQSAQYENEFATADFVNIDYVSLAKSISGINAIFGGFTCEEFRKALKGAEDFDGLTLIHVPVYYGSDICGGLGSYGRWNVGPWVDSVEKLIEEGIL